MPEGSDESLDRAKHGDQTALVELLLRHEPAVRAAVAGKIPVRHRAVLSEDDVLQETFAVAAAKIAQFNADSEGVFVRWLQKIARGNLRDGVRALDARKKGGKRTLRSADALSGVLIAEQTGPSTGADRGVRTGLLEEALAQLPEDYARVIELYDRRGCSVQEVAAAMGRSKGAVFMLRARALDCLHDHLGPTSGFFSGSA